MNEYLIEDKQQEEEYLNFANILDNAGMFVLNKIANEWNEYVDKICSYTDESKNAILAEIKATEARCDEQAEHREVYQKLIKENKNKVTLAFREFCEFKVDDKVFRKHHEYLLALSKGEDVSCFDENEQLYNEYMRVKEEKLNNVRKCRKNLDKIQKEYNEFIQSTKAKYRTDLTMKTNLNTKLKFQFQDGIKERLMNDKEIVYQMINSEVMLQHFNYLCRDMLKKINPDFFQTFSSYEQEEIASSFFTLILEKYKNNGIDFIQLVYERNKNDEITKLMVGRAFYMHFLVGFRNTFRRFMTLAYLSIHKEHFFNINIDETFDSGKREEDMGYDKINYFDENKFQDYQVKKNRKVWTGENILTCETINYWCYLKNYFLKNVDEMAKMTQMLFKNSDNFYSTYDFNCFKNAMVSIINAIGEELNEKNFVNSRIHHYVYMAFGGSRGGKVYFVRESKLVQNVLMFFMCKYIKDYESQKGDGETYSKFCEKLIERVSNNFKDINLCADDEKFIKKEFEFFEIS